ncbi:hypothetical protein WAI453_012021 [Rhynchosporium graminicola]
MAAKMALVSVTLKNTLVLEILAERTLRKISTQSTFDAVLALTDAQASICKSRVQPSIYLFPYRSLQNLVFSLGLKASLHLGMEGKTQRPSIYPKRDEPRPHHETTSSDPT